MNDNDVSQTESHAALLARIQELESQVAQLKETLDVQVETSLRKQMFVPRFDIADAVDTHRFMSASTCGASDLLHPEYRRICARLGIEPRFHRKVWEWAFIIHKLEQAGMLAAGKRGLVFGVGRERLPAYFASRGVSVVATDAPEEIGEQAGWTKSFEHSSSRDQLRYPDIVSNEQFDRHVSYRICDMTAIDKTLTGFDFTWSSCCFEHLGSLEAGLQFVVDSVEQTLKDGGIACHTTEFNLSSNESTLDHGPVVFYRKRDILALVERLQDLGHEVQPFVVAPDSHYLDSYIDLPPYRQETHLKLLMAAHVVTSAGIVIRKNGLRDKRQ